jgi:hypothetical protein
MSCCRALEYAEALDLSADRWAKMLVRRQEHDLEIIVAVAAASSRGPIDFRQSAGSRRSTNFRRSTDKNPHSEVHQSPGCPGVGYGRLRRFRIAVARARDPRLGVRLEDGAPSQASPVNLLLTITPQHPVIEECPDLGPKTQLIVHLGDEQRLVGLQGVTSCLYLMCGPRRICFLSSSWRFSARLAWVSRSRLRLFGSVPDRQVACLQTALVLVGMRSPARRNRARRRQNPATPARAPR